MDARQSVMSLSRQSTPLNILDLKDDVFEEIFSYLSFDHLSKIRLVCRRFNTISQSLLNKGFTGLQLYIKKCMNIIKAKLPRRDSERRKHSLSQHVTVLDQMELINTQFNLRYMVAGSCFIPGKFLDECYRLLKVMMTNQQNRLAPHEFMKELNDIFSTASNHFKEHIVPSLKQNLAISTFSRRLPFPIPCLPIIPKELKLEDRRLINNLRSENSELKSKVLAQEKQFNEHEQKWIQLEQHLGFSLSPKTTSSSVASTSGTTQQQSKRSIQDEEESRPSKQLQS